jgi:hypothetical protein
MSTPKTGKSLPANSSNAMSLDAVFSQYAFRYRKALALRVLLVCALAVACAAVLTQRFCQVGAPTAWKYLPGVSAAGFVIGLGLWTWKRWRSAAGLAAAQKLDRSLGLKERLLTVVEFSAKQPPPALYPALLQDTQTSVEQIRPRLPKTLSCGAAALAVMLLALLLWPRVHASLRQLAGTQPPPRPQPSSDRRQPGGSPQAPSGGGQSQAHGQTPNQQGSSQQASSSQSQQPSGQESSQGSRSASSEGSQQQAGQQHQSAGQQGGQQQGGQQSGQESSAQSTEGTSDSGSRSADHASGTAQGSPQGQGSDAGQEATKAEIRELLKELSGEVKNLKEQLSQQQSVPTIGTSTDPQLYGDSQPMDPLGEGNVGMRLQTDAAPVRSPRKNEGVGEASGEVSDQAPQAKAQDAQLSDDPVEEVPLSRQSVPAEYRGVFDRLNKR